MKFNNYFNAINNLYLTTKSKPWALQKPTVIQFPVDDICNARCQMCNIWQQKFDYHITPEELKKVLSSSLFSEVKAIGINGGEPTLRKDLAQLIEVIYSTLPNIETIALITNGLNSKQVIERISEIGNIIRNNNGKLDVMVSLDGVEEVHDRVRGRKGNFENALRVIDFIQSSELVTTKRLGCTVIKENIYGVEDLLEFALNKNIYIKYRLGIPHQRLYSQDVTTPFDLTFADKYHFAIFLNNLSKYYETSSSQNFFYQSLIGQLMYQKRRTAGCNWQHKGITLSARGEILYCAVESKTLGSGVTEDPYKLYFDNQSHLNDIVSNKCDTCSHDYVGLPPTDILVKGYAKKIFKKFNLDNVIELSKQLTVLKPLRNVVTKNLFNQRMIHYGVDLSKLTNLTPSSILRSSSSNSYKILICGWYGTETLGDKAILGGVIQGLKVSFGDMEIHLVSIEKYISQMTMEQMPELGHCTLYNIPKAIKIVKSMDLVVFGGGPLMAISNMAEMIAIFQQAVLSNIPTIIAGCGVGPLGRNYHNNSIKNLLNLSSVRIYRDQKSLETANSLGVDTSKDFVAEDPALTWIHYNLVAQDTITVPSQDQSPVLILGLRDWPYREYAPWLTSQEGEKIKEKFESELLIALRNFCNQYSNLKIIPFPMCTNHIGGDDRWFYRRLFRNESEIKNHLDLTYLGKEITPIEALKVYQSSSIALTMRFHALVFALGCQLPTIAIDYTLGKGKVKSLSEKSGIQAISLDLIKGETLYNLLSDLYTLNHPKKNNYYSLMDSLHFIPTLENSLKSMIYK